jgi:hypothetical protein
MIKELLEVWHRARVRKARNLLSQHDGIAITCDSAYGVPKAVVRGGAVNKDGGVHTLSIVNAINGRIIEIGSHRPNPHGPDWTFEHFIVPDGEPLEPAITTILLMKGMK